MVRRRRRRWSVRARSIRHCGAACQVNRSSDDAHGDGGGGDGGVISVKQERRGREQENNKSPGQTQELKF